MLLENNVRKVVSYVVLHVHTTRRRPPLTCAPQAVLLIRLDERQISVCCTCAPTFGIVKEGAMRSLAAKCLPRYRYDFAPLLAANVFRNIVIVGSYQLINGVRIEVRRVRTA